MAIDHDHTPPDGPFAVDATDRDGTVRLVLRGELDLAVADELRRAVADAFATTPPTVLIDLSGLRFIDSTGLRVVLEARELAAESGVELQLRRGPREVQRVFSLTGTEDALPFVD